MSKTSVSIVIPNWNGRDSLGRCLDSLQKQSQNAQIIMIDNGSTDGSAEYVERKYPEVISIRLDKNTGFAGGVNVGIRKATKLGAKYITLLNNDASADKDWLRHLVSFLDNNPKVGIATSKIYDDKKNHLDSTGESYTIWGLPYPRGRQEVDTGQYDKNIWIFGASGGASIYRVKMLDQIGLFDEDFFAYYEDVDLSFRAQLAGWKVAYVPSAVVYHQIGATSTKIKGFATYHTLKNLPLLLWKNVPWKLMPMVWPRLALAYTAIALNALTRGQISPFFKGIFMGSALLPEKLIQRHSIQKRRKVTPAYINSIMIHDLPPNAHKLRGLRAMWWRLRGSKV